MFWQFSGVLHTTSHVLTQSWQMRLGISIMKIIRRLTEWLQQYNVFTYDKQNEYRKTFSIILLFCSEQYVYFNILFFITYNNVHVFSIKINMLDLNLYIIFSKIVFISLQTGNNIKQNSINELNYNSVI